MQSPRGGMYKLIPDQISADLKSVNTTGLFIAVAMKPKQLLGNYPFILYVSYFGYPAL